MTVHKTGIPSTISANPAQYLKRKADAPHPAAPHFKKQAKAEGLDFLNQGATSLNPLPVADVASIEATFRAHRNLLRSNGSLARGSGQTTTTSAHFDGVLRSSRELPLITRKWDSAFGDVAKLLCYAAAHLTHIENAVKKDSHRIISIESETWRIHEEDYLAILSGKLQPDAFSYTIADLMKEFKTCEAEVESARSMRVSVQSVLRYINDIGRNASDRMVQLGPRLGKKIGKESCWSKKDDTPQQLRVETGAGARDRSQSSATIADAGNHADVETGDR